MVLTQVISFALVSSLTRKNDAAPPIKINFCVFEYVPSLTENRRGGRRGKRRLAYSFTVNAFSQTKKFFFLSFIQTAITIICKLVPVQPTTTTPHKNRSQANPLCRPQKTDTNTHSNTHCHLLYNLISSIYRSTIIQQQEQAIQEEEECVINSSFRTQRGRPCSTTTMARVFRR